MGATEDILHRKRSKDMTELEKKQSGEFYDTRDAQIRTAHNKAKELMKKYNDIPASEAEEREMLLRTK